MLPSAPSRWSLWENFSSELNTGDKVWRRKGSRWNVTRRGGTERGREDRRKRGEKGYFQFWQWNFGQNCWLFVSRLRKPWQCFASSLIPCLHWSVQLVCAVKLWILLSSFFFINSFNRSIQIFPSFFSLSFSFSVIFTFIFVYIVRFVGQFFIKVANHSVYY